MIGLFFRILIFDFLAAFCVAKLEINIEGKHGWAGKLPSGKINNILTRILLGKQHYTWYHLWFFLSTLLLLHLPFFISPKLWSPTIETFLLGNYAIAVILEDLFWFIFNPHFGLKGLNKTHAHWHAQWIGRIPLLYIKLGLFAFLMFSLSLVINGI